MKASPRSRLLALGAALCLALASPGCGGDDSSSGGSGAAAGTAGTGATGTGGAGTGGSGTGGVGTGGTGATGTGGAGTGGTGTGGAATGGAAGTGTGGAAGGGGISATYPPPPYGNNVGDTIADLKWEGYVNDLADVPSDQKPYIDYGTDAMRKSGAKYGLIHISAFT